MMEKKTQTKVKRRGRGIDTCIIHVHRAKEKQHRNIEKERNVEK
jgi:hypothetical protein